MKSKVDQDQAKEKTKLNSILGIAGSLVMLLLLGLFLILYGLYHFSYIDTLDKPAILKYPIEQAIIIFIALIALFLLLCVITLLTTIWRKQ
jgi:hypothetical protein